MEAEISFRSTSSVALVDCCASDLSVVRAARVSTVGAASVDADESAGLINFLVANRHNSPLEHSMFTFLVETPIFVAREFMRHRFASFNEWSGRYSKMKPEFYVPAKDRPLVQVGKPGAYTFVEGTTEQYQEVMGEHLETCTRAWQSYLRMLEAGVAREVARNVLPLSTFTAFYVTMNARGVMNFLSLRVNSPDCAYPTYPLREINEVADEIEMFFEAKMPLTYVAFVKHGRKGES